MINNHQKQLEGIQRNTRLQLNDLFFLYFQEEAHSFALVSKSNTKKVFNQNNTSVDALIALHLQGFVQEVYLEYQKRDRPYQLRLYDPKKIFEQIQVLSAQDKRFCKK